MNENFFFRWHCFGQTISNSFIFAQFIPNINVWNLAFHLHIIVKTLNFYWQHRWLLFWPGKICSDLHREFIWTEWWCMCRINQYLQALVSRVPLDLFNVLAVYQKSHDVNDDMYTLMYMGVNVCNCVYDYVKWYFHVRKVKHVMVLIMIVYGISRVETNMVQRATF